MKISELRVGMKHIDVEGEVLEKSETMEGYSRHGTVFRIAYALISDDTASIKLNLWNQQINGISVGDTIRIENASVHQYKGVKQLNVGRRIGKISIVKKAS